MGSGTQERGNEIPRIPNKISVYNVSLEAHVFNPIIADLPVTTLILPQAMMGPCSSYRPISGRQETGHPL